MESRLAFLLALHDALTSREYTTGGSNSRGSPFHRMVAVDIAGRTRSSAALLMHPLPFSDICFVPRQSPSQDSCAALLEAHSAQKMASSSRNCGV
ncbi:hypothetical protein K466DRAFT_89118 [Polyporus arcularius HHB13444]|uniref:Uncharacterized protein n=1 Tax=Polyporus arcularius HHB13444 TaxID=1314778 RepID=A0A5C3PG68_9APHY|nr:hypothetical protein K466DRAFT_89118 [Polyporus arcularius HHB13444]